METKEYRTHDKSRFEDGPWQHEPDKVQWQDETTGYPCLIVRNDMGALCGYVGVTEGHPLYEKDYNEAGDRVGCHGGLTFADHCQPDAEDHGICHIPSEGEPDNVWWLGFDCAHAFDAVPGMTKYSSFFDKTTTYRDIEYVKSEVTDLAIQLKEIEA